MNNIAFKLPKSKMVVAVDPSLWEEFKLDDPEMYERVRNAFYIGYGIESMRRLVQLPASNFEVTELMRVAPLLGVTKRDRVTKR